ncbi:CE11 : UDP-3-O-acyl N-acetylglucosamine deacetylase [Magnetospira sp. QH-2]|nr:CE11 : UDP-3-O-acyl N-acetylglucosamine deacetylase [Magnetospira sp. QH-2]
MTSLLQTTLKSPINCSGVGLHSGAKISMTLRPAEANRGIVFHRSDISGQGAEIPARWDNVTDCRLCTTLGNTEGASIGTVEHLMAALAGCGVDNVEIDINGPEVPIMDGSAAPFVFLIECAGIVDLDAPRLGIRIEKPISVGDGERFAALSPDDGISLGFEIDFDSAAIARQDLHLHLTRDGFKNEISRARTFGFLHEVEQLRAAGLARGGSLDNAVVVSGDKVLNEEGLRYDNEFVRHKVLDALGDLYLAGAPIIGRFQGARSGHQANNDLLRAMFADPSAWSMVELTAEDLVADSGEEPLLAATA